MTDLDEYSGRDVGVDLAKDVGGDIVRDIGGMQGWSLNIQIEDTF